MKVNKIKEVNKIQWGLNSYKMFKLKPNYKVMGGALGIIAIGFIVPDLSLTFILASCFISPIGFNKALKNKVEDIKYKIIKIKYQRFNK